MRTEQIRRSRISRIVATAIAAIGAGLLVPTFAQAPTTGEKLTLGDVELQLGMNKADAIARLKPLFFLSPSTDSVMVFRNQGSSHNPSYEKLGQVSFKDDRVAYLSKNWGKFQRKNSITFAKELYALLRRLQDGAREPITLRFFVDELAPGVESTDTGGSVEFVAGERSLTVSFHESKKFGNDVSIYEAVKSEALRKKWSNE